MPGTSEAAEPSRAEILLIEFLRDHDAPCPVCGYNLRALTRPICPECRQSLALAVGASRLRLGWLFAAIAPGFFSGIAAMLLLLPILISYIFGDPAPLPFVALDVFGLLSGGFAIILAARRVRFIAQPIDRQRRWAIAIWLIHFAALVAFFVLMTL